MPRKPWTSRPYAPGDIVRHRAAFLRSIGWYTDVPRDGRVVAVEGRYLTVRWCDRDDDVRILDCNVQHSRDLVAD